jgi:hypothetical protein
MTGIPLLPHGSAAGADPVDSPAGAMPRAARVAVCAFKVALREKPEPARR